MIILLLIILPVQYINDSSSQHCKSHDDKVMSISYCNNMIVIFVIETLISIKVFKLTQFKI